MIDVVAQNFDDIKTAVGIWSVLDHKIKLRHSPDLLLFFEIDRLNRPAICKGRALFHFHKNNHLAVLCNDVNFAKLGLVVRL